MTRAEIIQEIHKRASIESPWPKDDHLYDLIHGAAGIRDSFYRKYPDLLLALAAQIVRVLDAGE